MRYDEITTSQRSLLLSPVAFHREHYHRLLSQLEAQSVPEGDRLRVAVERAKDAVDSLVYLLAEQLPADRRQSST
jgi:hypothetical protein